MNQNTHTKASSPWAIQQGKIARPQKVVLHGPAGVGKTTLASTLPNPVFLDTEGGTHHLDVARFQSSLTWEEITTAITQLASTEHDFKTLVVDTADWLEKRLAEYVCRKANKRSIEEFGYGKGWVVLAEEFARFLASLEPLIARGMHVVFLAHSMVRKFEAPDQAGSYDRYELKLSKQVAPLLMEWADAVLFGTYVTRTVQKDSGKLRGVGGKERVIFANHSAAFDAKNRHGLPDKVSFSVEALEAIFGDSGTAQPSNSAPKPSAPSAPSLAERLREAFGADEAEVIPFLIDRQQIKAGESWDAVPEGYAKRALKAPERFLESVAQFHKAQEVASKQ